MNSYSKTCLLAFAVSLAMVLCVPAIAQQSADLISNDQTSNNLTAPDQTVADLTVADLTAPDQTGSAPAPQKTTATQTSSGGTFANPDADLSDNKWHYYAVMYIWIPGVHGTLGVHNEEASVSLSASDIFSNFRGGFLGAFVPTYNRFLAPVDFMWLRLKPSKVIPRDPNYSATATMNMTITTPKVAYLLVKNPKVRIYGTAGPRIWHMGTSLNVEPPIRDRNPSVGLTWTDFVMGGRFAIPLSPKVVVDVAGDAGEGGATLDYQVQGFLNYQAKPKLTLQAGWRYLTVHYGNNGNGFNGSIQGILLGATYKFK